MKICDYLIIRRHANRDDAIFVELKRTLSDEEQGKEQLRRSLPYLDYLRSVCRIEYGPTQLSARAATWYVLIGKKISPRLGKQRVSGGHRLSDVRYRDIKVSRFVGTRVQFAWLGGI